MTENEAIEIIKFVPLYRYECELEKCRQSELFQALSLSIKALEKQMPKKPTYKHQIGVSTEGKIYKGKCCECGHEQKQKWWITQTFCDNCGQALDWSDTE